MKTTYSATDANEIDLPLLLKFDFFFKLLYFNLKLF